MSTPNNRRDFYEPQLFHDHFQNFKSYNIPRAQLVIADVPYNLGKNAYASNPSWYKDGDNKNGESELAGKMFFESDGDFSPAHFMIFCERLLRKEGMGEKGEAVGLPRLPDGRYIDILLRMLKPSELAAAHSFPKDYVLTGNRSDQVKQIGNSVPVMTAAAMCEVDFKEVA